VVVQAIWSKSNEGAFKVFIDGVEKSSYNGRTLAVRTSTYAKWGIYGQPTHLFFDEVKIAEGPNGFDVVNQ
jgi:hypothetical protein